MSKFTQSLCPQLASLQLSQVPRHILLTLVLHVSTDARWLFSSPACLLGRTGLSNTQLCPSKEKHSSAGTIRNNKSEKKIGYKLYLGSEMVENNSLRRTEKWHWTNCVSSVIYVGHFLMNKGFIVFQ